MECKWTQGGVSEASKTSKGKEIKREGKGERESVRESVRERRSGGVVIQSSELSPGIWRATQILITSNIESDSYFSQ